MKLGPLHIHFPKGPGWPNERGWYALGLFVQTAMVFALIAYVPALRTDEFFKSIATAVVVTGWIGFAVGQRGNAEERETAAKAVDLAHRTTPTPPQPVTVVNPPSDPVPVEPKP